MIEGLLQAHPTVITSRDHCCQLLGHEASRVLHDRLTNDADRRYFYQVLSDQLHNGFKARWSPEELEKTPLIFGDFLEGSSPHGPRAYRFVRQYDRLPQILEVRFSSLFVCLLRTCHCRKTSLYGTFQLFHNTDNCLLQTVHLVIETKIHIVSTSIIRTTLYCRQFSWSQRDQNSYSLYLYNKNTSLMQTVHLVPERPKFIETRLYYGQFTSSQTDQNSSL